MAKSPFVMLLSWARNTNLAVTDLLEWQKKNTARTKQILTAAERVHREALSTPEAERDTLSVSTDDLSVQLNALQTCLRCSRY